jgi:uncharacterized repeat protein (TIGR03806 family)
MGSPDRLPPLEVETAFPKLRFDRPLQFVHAGDGTNRIFVVEQGGRVYVFPNRPDVTEDQRKLFLDLSRSVSRADNEEGMMSIAFHPKYRENGLFFVYYTVRPLASVVARLRVSKEDPDRADPESFAKILGFPQPFSNHNGGSMQFGPDGFLYIGLGDGGSGGDPHRYGQNLKTLLGKMLRIDVDREDPGLKYAIPKDNPFAGRSDGTHGEIWAYGLRNVWRLSFDRLTGTLWAGDVGQDLWEEIDVIVRGGNYGWNLREGTHPFRPNLAKGDEKLIEPVIDYHHSVGKSVTGGVVYRGKRLPDLYGAYLYADFVSGTIWALRYDGQKMTHNQVIAQSKLPVSSFGEDESGEVYFTAFDGHLHKFRTADRAVAERQPPFPRKLSETGLFASVKDLTPAPGLIPYTVNVPLWSDHGAKQRLIALPKARSVEYSPQEQWKFPKGTVLVKTFFLDTTRNDPATRRRLETRLLVHNERGWDGYTYLWNDDQTEATLLDVALAKPYTVTTANGKETQPWYFPSRADCQACHTEAAGHVLGLSARQINRPEAGDNSLNQLRRLWRLGLFTEASVQQGAGRPTPYPDWSDPRADKSVLARAYLDVNCAICHTPGGRTGTNLDMRFHTPLAKMMLIDETPGKGRIGPADSKLVAPGDPARSELYVRMKTRGPGQMPNLATAVPDEEALEVIAAWIKSLGARAK